MMINILSILLGFSILLAILNPVSIITLLTGQAVADSTASTIWMLLSLAIILLIASLLYALWRDLSLQNIYEDNQVTMAGQKGGQAEKKMTENDIYIQTLREQSKKLNKVSQSNE